ncbi:MAG: DUF4184 family protein [Flavobacteriales bacterium]|nr:DUF4184 family protein [Flavobacteriales bacterium]
MGFTFSHPALIVPFKYVPRRWYSVTGLIAGSIAPDFEYFLRLDSQGAFSHTIPGMFLMDIPMAIGLALVFHLVVRDQLILNIPRAFRQRFEIYFQSDWWNYLKRNIILVIFSVLIGVMTHLLWDSFTAMNGHFVKRIPFLTQQWNILGLDIYVYKVLKHVSSVVGGMVVLYQLLRLPKKNTLIKNVDGRYWVTMVSIFVIIVIFYLLPIFHMPSINVFVKRMITAGLAALVLASLYHRKKQNQ